MRLMTAKPFGGEACAADAVIHEGGMGDGQPGFEDIEHRFGIDADFVLRVRVGAQRQEMQQIMQIDFPVPLRVIIERQIHARQLAREARLACHL